MIIKEEPHFEPGGICPARNGHAGSHVPRRLRLSAPAPESPADTPLALREALSRLPEKLRVVLALYYMEGFNVTEVSRILRISTGAVCSRLSRGRDQMRAMLKEEIE